MEWFTADDYWLSRLVFQRALAAVYLVAFLAAARQFRALIGERGHAAGAPRSCARVVVPAGAQPVPPALLGPLLRGWSPGRAPRCRRGPAGRAADRAAAGGGDGCCGWCCGLLYLSIVNVGQIWYGFGWESLLLEAGFLAVFLGNADTAPPVLVLWLLRWLLFRVEFGAGLIKIRGDALLAQPDLPVLPPRDPADARPAELVLPPPAAAAAPGGGGGQPRHPARRAVRCCSPRSRWRRRRRRGSMIVTQLWLVLSRQLRLAELARPSCSPCPRSPDARSPVLPTARRRAGRPALVRGRGPRRRPRCVLALSYRPGAQPALPPPGDEPLLRPAATWSTPTARSAASAGVRHEVVVEGTDDDARARRTPSGWSTSSRASRAIRSAGRASSRRTICGWTG